MMKAPSAEWDEDQCKSQLWLHFGYSEFRPGQLEAIRAVLSGRDALVVMATGSGKSICFQLPALMTNKAVVVISPLISLMQDQVIRLNQTLRDGCATFLGPSQPDPLAEEKVRSGKVQFVYMTPEKAQNASALLSALSRSKGIALVAIDEAHCVCEWGNDFRPEYQNLSILRTYLPSVPIVGLTATAVPKIQDDIVRSLRLAEPFKWVGDFARPNLAFSCKVKKSVGLAFADLVEEMKSNKSPPATIIYCSTTNDVDSVASWLQLALEGSNVLPLAYHGKMGQGERHNAHIAFLTGRCSRSGKLTPLIVASVAFGMGIDKPDVRRVIHYGIPTTLEAYYQQAGRAGRDGLPAKCELHFSSSEFAHIKTSSFYRPKGMAAEHVAFLDKSVDSLQAYAETNKCRQDVMVRWFGGMLSKPCGLCDNCSRSNDEKLDCTADIHRIISAVRQRPTSMGKLVEGLYSTRSKDTWALPSTRKDHFTDYVKELIALLKSRGYLQGLTKSFEAKGGFGVGYEEIHITPKSSAGFNEQFLLPVPRSVLEFQRAQKEMREKRIKEMEAMGINTKALPAEEVAHGKGPAMDAEQRWAMKLKNMRARDDCRATKLEELHEVIMTWRQDWAVQQQMAPGSVMADWLVKNVAYVAFTGPISLQALTESGVRGQAAASLLAKLQEWQQANQSHLQAEESLEGGSGVEVMILPKSFKRSWPGAPKCGPVQQASYEMFFKQGLDLATIAIRREKPIQAQTVLGHLCAAMLNGLEMDLSKLSEYALTRAEFDKFNDAIKGMDINDTKFQMKPVFVALEEKVDYSRLNFTLALLRLGVQPEFCAKEPSAKRQRTESPHAAVKAASGA